MRGLPIRTDLSAAELRALARRESRPRVAPRQPANAHVPDGRSRAEAVWLRGMEPQALCGAVLRFDAEGIYGGVLLTPDGFVVGAGVFGRRMQPLLRSRRHVDACSAMLEAAQ